MTTKVPKIKASDAFDKTERYFGRGGKVLKIKPIAVPGFSATAYDPVTKAQISGTFSQSPAEGALVEATTKVVLTFTPSNPSIYQSTSVTRKFVVSYDDIDRLGKIKFKVPEIIREATVRVLCSGEEVEDYIPYTLESFVNDSKCETIDGLEVPGEFTQEPAEGEEVYEDTDVTLTFTINPDVADEWEVEPSSLTKTIRVIRIQRNVCPVIKWESRELSGQDETWYLPLLDLYPHIVGSRGETDAVALDPETGQEIGGDFTYDPAPGEEKKESFPLTASFTPADPLFYDSTERTISMQVETFSKVFGESVAFNCWIENFTSSISFGAQGGNLQMTLVEDPRWDLRWVPPAVGTALYFKYGEFYFGGVFQRYTYEESTSGRRYNVILESPGGKILNGTHVILSDFDGGTWTHDGTLINFGFGGGPPVMYGDNFDNSAGIRNVLNPLAYWENTSEGGNFGAAETNSAGFPARKLLDTLEILSRGESEFGDRIFFGESEYELDLSELKVVPENFRISNQVTTVTSIIEECCEILQYNYVLEVVGEGERLPPAKPAETVFFIEKPIIKVKVIDRSAQPDIGAVQALITEREGDDLVSYSHGQELSDEPVQQMVVGAPASRYVMGDVPGMIPVWGKTVDGKWLLQRDLDGCPAAMPAAYGADEPVPIQVTQDQDAFMYTATVDELRMATAGRATWQAFKVFESVANGTYDIDPWVADLEVTEEIISLMAQKSVGTLALSSTSLKLAKLAYNLEDQSFRERSVDAIFNAVQKCANNFFGRVFLAAVPEEPGGVDNNLKYKNERPQDQYTSLADQVSSWAPASSAWVENRPVDDLDFYDESGKMRPIAVWAADPLGDYNALGSNYGFYNDGSLFGVASTTASYANGGEFIYWTDFRNDGGGNCGYDPDNNGIPCAVVDAGAQVKFIDEWTGKRKGLPYFAFKFFGISLSEENILGFSTQLANIEIPPRIEAPGLFGMPQISNRYSWGPWYSFNATNGRSEVSFDTNLAPENFGSIATMEQMGQAYVESTLAEVTQHETGRVRFAKKPEYNITDRLAGAGPYVTSISCSVDTGGIYTDYEYATWTPKFGKLAKYNSDRLSRIYKDTIRALKFLRGRIQKPPIITQGNKLLRLLNDDRLKRNRGTGTALGFTQFGAGVPIPGANIAARTFEGSVSDLNDAFATSYNALASDPWAQYKLSFSCSQEQMFSPYQVSKNKSGDSDEVPKVEAQSTSNESGRFTGGNIIPSSEELDPYFPNQLYGYEDDGSEFINKTDYHSVINESGSDGDLTQDLQIKKLDDPKQLAKVRSVGIRGPAVMSGWGYDLANNPVPFQPTDSDQGTEEDITLFDKTASDDRTKWETGPVKLMWDKERKVWAGGHDILVGILKTDITAPSDPYTPTTFELEVLRKVNTPKGQDALALKGETITGYNRDTSLTVSAGPEVFLMVQRINYEWVPVKSAGGGAEIIFFQTDGYTDVPESQIIYITMNRLSCTDGRGIVAPSEDPDAYPGFPEGAELLYKGYAYDVQSNGDAYLQWTFMYRVCNTEFNALAWADNSDAEMGEWVDSLEEQDGGNCDWIYDDSGRLSYYRDDIEDTIAAVTRVPAGQENVDVVPVDPARLDPDNCDDANRCDALPTPEKNKAIEVTILARTCGSTTVPQENNGRVTVVDTMDAFLYGRTADDIKGRKGSAVYVQNDGEYDCYWAILWMDMFDTITMVHDIVFGTNGVTIERKKVDIWWHCDLVDEYIEGNTCEDS